MQHAPPHPLADDRRPRRPPAAGKSAAILPRAIASIAAVAGAVVVAQTTLGWGLGVAAAGLTLLVAASLMSAIAITDAAEDEVATADEHGYAVGICVAAALSIVLATALLYLPMPWGGIGAAALVAAVAASLRLA